MPFFPVNKSASILFIGFIWSCCYLFVHWFRLINDLLLVSVVPINITIHTKTLTIIGLVRMWACHGFACCVSAISMIAMIAHAFGVVFCISVPAICYLFLLTPSLSISHLLLSQIFCLGLFLDFSLIFFNYVQIIRLIDVTICCVLCNFWLFFKTLWPTRAALFIYICKLSQLFLLISFFLDFTLL